MEVVAKPGEEGETPRFDETAGAPGGRPRVAAGCGALNAAPVGDGDWSLDDGRPGDLFEGTVLLRWTPPLGVFVNEGP
jgi:hypothetical protein